MIIRRAEEKDLEPLLDLYDQLYDILIREHGFPFAFSRDENKAVLSIQIRSKLCCIFVAEQDDGLVGFVHGSISKLDRRLSYEGQKAIARIDDVYVSPETRGSGVADALMQEAEAWFRSEEIAGVESYIVSGNQQSLRFHQKRGFATIASRTIKPL